MWAQSFAGLGSSLLVLAYRTRAYGKRAAECPSVLAYPAPEDEVAWDVPARAGAAAGELPRQLRVGFTRVTRLPRHRAKLGGLATVRAWAADPTQGLDDEWLPDAEVLQERARAWLDAQDPPAQAGAPGGAQAAAPAPGLAPPAAPGPPPGLVPGGAPAAAAAGAPAPAPGGAVGGGFGGLAGVVAAAVGGLRPGASTDPFREWETLDWWDNVEYEHECSKPTVTTRTVPLEQRAMVRLAKARALVVLDRASTALRGFERHAAHLRGQGAAVPNELTVSLAVARLHEERAWKLVSLVDQLLFATSPRGGQSNKSFGEVLRCRLQWLENGHWALLYRDVERCRRAGAARGRRQARQGASQSVRGRARRVSALYNEGEWGKATSAVMAKDPPRRDRAALRELRALFPRATA